MKLRYPSQKFNRLGVAVSGGADSVALLLLLLREKDRFAETLVVYTVNHGIRGERAAEDAAFVRSLCDRLGVECHVLSADVPAYAKAHKIGVEEAARAVRYGLFSEILDRGEVEAIATAHHADDVAETVLFRLLRGSGLSGVSGVLERRPGFFRPLLSVTKEELLSFLTSQNQPYVVDETNLCSDFSRNFLRNEVLPKIEDRFPKAKEHLAAFSHAAKEDEALLASLAAPYVRENTVLPCESRPLFFRALLSALRATGFFADYRRPHLEAAFALQEKPVGATEELPYGFLLEKTRVGVTVHPPKTPYFEIPFAEGVFNLPCGEFCVERVVFDENGFAAFPSDFAQLQKRGVFYLDADRIPENAVFRQRKKGDRFQPFGHTAEKKLKDFFAAQKLTSAQKDGVAVLASPNGEIYAALPFGVSERAKITKETRVAIRITFVENAPFLQNGELSAK